MQGVRGTQDVEQETVAHHVVEARGHVAVRGTRMAVRGTQVTVRGTQVPTP